MASSPRYSVAPGDTARSRILSRWALFGMAALAVGALVLVFPNRDLMSLLRDETDRGNRDLTVAYLQNIIRTEPRDLALRLLLVEKLLAANQLDAARQALADSLPLARLTPVGQESWDGWDLAWWQARLRATQSAKDLTQTTQAVGELMTRLIRRVDSANTSAKIFAAISATRELSLTLGTPANPALAAQAQTVQDQLLTRLLALPQSTAADLTRGASLALADGRFGPASELFFAARRKTTSPEARFKLLEQGVQALLAGGQSHAAWQAAMKESRPLPDTDPSYWWLASLALGAGEPKESGLALRHVIAPNADVALLANTLTAQQLQLAWDIFASADDLPEALKVVDAALRQQPHNVEWLERKAQASEWAGMAPQALKAWLELMKRGNSDRALASVFRLSPMLYDDDALLAAWLTLSRQRTLTTDEVGEVVAVYERLGSVQGALNFISALRAKGLGDGTAESHWTSLQAQLLDGAGRSDEAVTLLESLRPAGLSQGDAMRLARLYLRKAQIPLALRALKAVRPDAATALNEEYWSVLADVAYETGDTLLAEQALDKLLAKASPSSYQAQRAIQLRLTEGHDTPRNTQGLRLAAALYARYPNNDIVFTWMNGVGNQKTPSGLYALLAALRPEHRTVLEQSADFLERRAGLYARLGSAERALARQDYQKSLRLRPDHAPTRSAYWWLLLDQSDLRTLRREVTQADRSVLKNPAYAEVLSSVWQILGEPLRALALMQPLARARGDDFLWLMTYADVLERSGRASAALRVRHHAWQQLGRQTTRVNAKPLEAERARQALLAQLRLASEFASGEEKSRLWRALTALAVDTKDAVQKRQNDELVGAWLLSEGRFDAAQRWLWQQQAARMSTPAYQVMAVALSQNDRATMASLLDEAQINTSASLSPQDRITALRQLQRRNEAATTGMESALRSPEGPTDDLQQALQEDLLATASRASLQTTTRHAGVLSRQETLATAAVFIAPHLKLSAELSSGAYHSRDTRVIAATPQQDREARLGFETTTPWGELSAQALRRQALTGVNGVILQFTGKLAARSTLQLSLARGDRSDESSAMSVVGMRDRATASLSLPAGERLDGQLSLEKNAFRTQTGAALGSSIDAAMAANWMLRKDHPDVRLQTQLRRSVMRADGQPDAATALLQPGGGTPDIGVFLPPSSTAFSASIGVGLAQSNAQVYSRAWRPWGEIGFETRLASGGRQTQGLLRLGAKGAVAGHDQLSVHLDIRPGSGGLSGSEGSRELRMKYELFFDR